MSSPAHGVDCTAAVDPELPGVLWLTYRCFAIAAIVLLYVLPGTAVVLLTFMFRGRRAAEQAFYRGVAKLLQRLGPTFVKFGQIMSSRRDALPADLCKALSVLHDRVQPMKQSEVRRALASAYGAGENAMFRPEQLMLVASGSIAGVFYAAWRSGVGVALKLQRPGIARRMKADLRLLEGLVRLAERLPKCQGMPIGDLTAFVSKAILGQLDFVKEAANLERLRKSLSIIPDVVVPSVMAPASVPGCMVMEFVPGLDACNVEEHSRASRQRLALTALAAVRQMIFVDGFVHCDLHPGNLYVTREGEVVILDAGFSVQLPNRVRQLIAEFFMELSRGNGRRCAEIIIESAVRARPRNELQNFIEAVACLVRYYSGPEAPPFAMMEFGNALFDLQREYGLYAESDFVFPLMALAVTESTVRNLSEDVDFKELGRLTGSHSLWHMPGREGARAAV